MVVSPPLTAAQIAESSRYERADEAAMSIQELKVAANAALDRRAGRVLSFDERRSWWTAEDRYLRCFDDDEREGILREAETVYVEGEMDAVRLPGSISRRTR